MKKALFIVLFISFCPLAFGQYGLLGITVGKPGDTCEVIQLTPEYPGEKSGVKVGDKIIKINGITVAGKSRALVLDLLRTPEDSIVNLVLYRHPEMHEIQIIKNTIEEQKQIDQKNGTNQVSSLTAPDNQPQKGPYCLVHFGTGSLMGLQFGRWNGVYLGGMMDLKSHNGQKGYEYSDGLFRNSGGVPIDVINAYTGASDWQRYAITVGLVSMMNNEKTTGLYGYMGGGYGVLNFFHYYETTVGGFEWVWDKDASAKGFELDFGLGYRLNKFWMSAGFTNLNFKFSNEYYSEVQFGLGFGL